MDEETIEFEANAKAFAVSVSELEALITPLVSTPFDELVLQSEALIDRASLCVLFSYIINSLAFLYLRTQGATKGHPVRKELARVKEYMDKVSTVAGTNKPSTQLDQEAAKRFIKHTLSNNPEIKEKYKQEKERGDQAEKFLDSILSTGAPTADATSTAIATTSGKRARNEESTEPSTAQKKKTPKTDTKKTPPKKSPSNSSKKQK
ncbi:UNVERIFIED_CONTAM: hypothetical protein HDU68_010435 [Siphonaria sp. JEL0065]|nr:hypothetical protein HDU68_010435 [Siphonaria sp. JEL0065]